jgi:hypothetical protein
MGRMIIAYRNFRRLVRFIFVSALIKNIKKIKASCVQLRHRTMVLAACVTALSLYTTVPVIELHIQVMTLMLGAVYRALRCQVYLVLTPVTLKIMG